MNDGRRGFSGELEISTAALSQQLKCPWRFEYNDFNWTVWIGDRQWWLRAESIRWNLCMALISKSSSIIKRIIVPKFHFVTFIAVKRLWFAADQRLNIANDDGIRGQTECSSELARRAMTKFRENVLLLFPIEFTQREIWLPNEWWRRRQKHKSSWWGRRTKRQSAKFSVVV